MAIDPICSMTVDPATARSAVRDGQTFYFCSEHCRRKFLAEGTPATAKHHGQDRAHHEPTPGKQRQGAGNYFCPMCAGVESDRPGNCPKCGMALEPARPAASRQQVTYTSYDIFRI
jgi:Cu+-exporting ATPase